MIQTVIFAKTGKELKKNSDIKLRKAMQTNKFIMLVCIGVLSFGLTLIGQSLTNKPLFETESIKVVANEEFPKDLESEIFIGPKGSPYFTAEGTSNQLKAVRLESIGAGPVVSMVQKEGETNSYILYLFTGNAEGFFDLNVDGIWDVKKTPTQNQKIFIFFQGQWLAVDKIDGLLSKTPTAKSGDKKYAFQGVWQLAN
jgi:hypothetical protein